MKHVFMLLTVLVYSISSYAATGRWRAFSKDEKPVIVLHQVSDGHNVEETFFAVRDNGLFPKLHVFDVIVGFSEMTYTLDNGTTIMIPAGSNFASDPELRRDGQTITLVETQLSPALLETAKASAATCESAF